LSRLLVVAGLIEGPEGYLISQRPKGHLKDRWEFPGGKLEPGEAPEAALQRELMEELGIEVEVGDIYAVGHHIYPEHEVILMLYRCCWSGGSPRCLQVKAFRWLSLEALLEVPFPPADEAIIRRLRREQSR